MKKYILAYIVCMLSVQFLCGVKAGAQVPFANRKIVEIADRLGYKDIPVRDSLVIIPEVLASKAVVFEHNSKGEVNHIGVSLFSHETKMIVDRDICNFIERVILELLLQPDKDAVKRKLREYRIELFIDGQGYSDLKTTQLSSIMDNMDMPATFDLKNKGKTAEAVWSYGGHKVVLVFPLSRELISGTDKKESDDMLYDELRIAVFLPVNKKDEAVSADVLEPVGGGLYLRRGEVYAIKALSSDIYYVKKGNSFVPVFDRNFPVHSMNNLFLTYANGAGKILDITHRRYGSFTPEVSIPLLNFLNVFAGDFHIVCHTGYVSDNRLETIVVFTHKLLNYIHILRATIAEEQLFSEDPVFKVDFYSNIPQYYIKSLLK